MYKFQNINGKCEILLYSLIDGSGFDGISAQNVIQQIKEAGENISVIDLRINSDGGDVFEAIAMYNFLKAQKARVNVFIDGLAASAASIVACAGKIFMPANSFMMIHNPVGSVFGESDDMRETADVLDKIRDTIANIYSQKTGKKIEDVTRLMKAETWLTADEAYNFGLADKIIDAKNQAKHLDTTDIQNAVENERERIRQLDALKAPGFETRITAAKYETFENAKDLAFEILSSGKLLANSKNRELDTLDTQNIYCGVRAVDDLIDSAKNIAMKINERRK